ncbi:MULTISPECIES: leucyl aminopeptidase [unclassified Wenzhouxiangella]|uniref:leucyl aminopeptidase n=1 Tax=unclassified Wenzhouxiangella TaxID=2613841 RepID=UPI000E329A95|nr:MULTISPECIES: leucyl aminopeptidase [unclassified Wenzhouxiangella]RFF27739.1 leucyl aminopeptidase [Wenzhouxiangella sp. 15181]RFP69042.1 leucyl aminopeptidase [Wenzhouxiangella sp. 15190]
MQFTTTDATATAIETDCLVAGLGEAGLSGPLSDIDKASDGLLSRLHESGDLPQKASQTVLLHAVPGIKAARLLVVGLGKAEKLDGAAFDKAVKAAGKALRQSRATSAHCLLADHEVTDRASDWKVRQAGIALAYADYVYSATKKPKDDAPPATDTVSFPAGEGVEQQLGLAEAIAAGVQRARDLADLPPNICTPAYLAEIAEKMAAEHDGLEVEILEQEAMEKLEMNALLAVAVGSANRPRLIRLSWKGGKDSDAPLAMVGKGVTFDTGGISIKPRDLMEQMKFDMGGAAATIGAMEAVARLKLPMNIEGVVAAVENMPDGKAYRPGDVITAMNGKTIEVHNTDAEGRMILADALTWTERLNPDTTVDLATLTGACVVALGHHASAVMTQDDELAEELLSAGQRSADRTWRLPLWDDYQEQIDSPFADMKNIGGMPAGSITAGCFLSRFAEGQRWAHIDIAGAAWQWGKPESGTGRPVGMLVDWMVDRAGGWDVLG